MSDQGRPNVATLFARALQHHQRGDLAAARAQYTAVLARDPRHAESLHHLGIVAMQSGQADEAVDLIGRAITLNGKVPDFHYSIGSAYGVLGRFDQVVVHSRLAIELKPDHLPSIINLGQALMAQGRKDEAIANYRSALATMPGSADLLFSLANALADSGQSDDAVAAYRRAIDLKPDLSDAHSNLGTLLAAQGSTDEAIASYETALQLNPNLTVARFNLANALRDKGRMPEAAAEYRAVLRVSPGSAEANNNYGALLLFEKKYDEAAACFQRAVAARPDFAAAHRNLGKALMYMDQASRAIEVFRKALSLAEDDETKLLLHDALTDERSADHASRHRDLILRALAESWGASRLIVSAGRCLFGNPTIAKCIAKLQQAAPAHPAPDTVFEAGDLTALADDRLLVTLLQTELIADEAFERLLTAMRYALLRRAAHATEAGTTNNAMLELHCALAWQSHLSDYAYAQSDDELALVGKLREALAHSLKSGMAPNPAWIPAIASYTALGTLPDADALIDVDWPTVIRTVLEQQIVTRREVQRQAEQMPALTPVDDVTSQRVANLYERFPYPQWGKFPRLSPKPMSVGARLRWRFPGVPLHLEDSAKLDLLIAGCGTRQAAIIARTYSDVRITAIDLSRPSLGYAKHKTDQLGYANIEYGQADILNLGSLGREFDVIVCSGVLHHMADPIAGWRSLLSILRPRGCMQISLYSDLARRCVVAARAWIAASGYGSSPDEIRRCRQAILALPDDSPVKDTADRWDFYSLGMCSDMLFHPQEHRFTIPQIEGILELLGLAFVGFDIEPQLIEAYHRRFPDDTTKTNLKNWHAFEQENPNTFAGMYLFWVQRQEVTAST
jgi:tetratricopeptide (TPR) repeat protein/2-polyprenyl-3-methyl-5-hydroxy-6-metoxy-1,4-benzoquinol methylase